MTNATTIHEGESLYTAIQLRDIMTGDLLEQGTDVGDVYAISYYLVTEPGDEDPSVVGPISNLTDPTLNLESPLVEWDLDTTGANFTHTLSLAALGAGQGCAVYYVFLIKRDTSASLNNPYMVFERRVQIAPLRRG